MPTFLLGLLLLYFLYFRLTLAGHAWFPAGGYAPLSEGVGPWVNHLVLPWFTLALVSAADLHPAHPRPRCSTCSARTTSGPPGPRASASGGSIYRHGLRSALTPIVTQFGIDLGQLLGGVVVTETVFSLPGPRARPPSTRSTSRTCR